MKIYPDKLGADLKSRIRKLYIVSGDEQLLVQETTDLIRRMLRTSGFEDRKQFYAESGFDWKSLMQSAGAMSLFFEKKLIEVTLPSGKPGGHGSEMLMELLNQLNKDNVLLLILPKVGQDVQRTKWFKALEAEGAFIQIWPIEVKSLPGWLTNRFQQAGLRVSREAAQLMADRVEGNLLAAVQEIERLRLISSNGQIDVQQVTEGVSENARYDVFQLLDSALGGDPVRSFRLISGLKAEGVELMFVLSVFVRELRNLEKMKTDLESGQSRETVFKRARVWKKREVLVSRFLDRRQLLELRQMISLLGYTDRLVKGAEQGDPWRVLQEVILRLAGKPAIKSLKLDS